MSLNAIGRAQWAAALGAAIALGAGLAIARGQAPPSSQQPSPVPIFTPGPVDVVGTVNIGNEPVVSAQQVGPWIVDARQAAPWLVTVANGPFTAPPFVAENRSYRFTWPGGGTERYRIVNLLANGWARAAALDDAGVPTVTERWLNLTMTVTIEELP